MTAINPLAARPDPAPGPTPIEGGETVFSEAFGGHRFELFATTDSDGAELYVIAVNGHPVEVLRVGRLAACAAYGRCVGALR